MDYAHYRNMYEGVTVYVVGSGKTMDYVAPRFFADKFVIGVNYSAVGLPMAQGFHVSNHQDDADKVAAMSSNRFVWTSEVEQVPATDTTNAPITQPNVILAPTTDQKYGAFDPESDWSNDRLILGPSSVTLAMSLAYYIGADSIVLCGVDCGDIDGAGRFDGYEVPEGQLVYGVWQKALDDMAGALRSRGVSVYSLNPWTTLARDGHKFHGA